MGWVFFFFQPLLLLSVFEYFACTCICASYICSNYKSHKRMSYPLGKGVTDSHEPLCGFWESNQGSQEEQPMFLTTELSLQPQALVVLTFLAHFSLSCLPNSSFFPLPVSSKHMIVSSSLLTLLSCFPNCHKPSVKMLEVQRHVAPCRQATL